MNVVATGRCRKSPDDGPGGGAGGSGKGKGLV